MAQRARLTEEEKRAIQFACKWDIRLNARNLQNIKCGLHSGFPKCCVLFHTIYWRTIIDTADFDCGGLYRKDDLAEVVSRFPRKRSLQDCINWGLSDNVFYVRCPSCRMSGKSNKIKLCECWKQPHRQAHWNHLLDLITTKRGKLRKAYQRQIDEG